jgi:hypothetical protein
MRERSWVEEYTRTVEKHHLVVGPFVFSLMVVSELVLKICMDIKHRLFHNYILSKNILGHLD